MSYLELTNTITGSGNRVYHTDAPPVDGTDEVQSLDITGSPTGGSYRLSFRGHRSAAIAYDATAAEVEAALEAIPSIGSGNVVVTDTTGALPYVLTFAGALGARALPLVEVAENALTGGTDPDVAITETTPGVDGTRLDLGVGALLADDSTGELYVNTGSAGNPTWVVAGSQS